jgi:hypothetical protein
MDSQFCEIGIAIHKEAYTKYLIADELPPLVKFTSGKPYEDALYWHLTDIEWFTAKPQLTDFFEKLSDESHVDIYVTQPGQVKIPLYSKECYGVIRIGDDPTIHEEWGNPSDA